MPSGLGIPVIVTRAEPGASETAARLAAMGLQPVRAPVLTLKPNADTPILHAEALSGLVFTSANGVRCYAARAVDRDLPAWCVGPATARAAREAGFDQVFESAGNASDLAAFIATHTKPDRKPLLHVANTAAKGDLKRRLEQASFKVTFCPLYKMVAASELPAAVQALLGSEAPAIVLIHSAKGAEAFASLVQTLPTGQLIAGRWCGGCGSRSILGWRYSP
ncbi:MAG: uroporphyrinogen-III synthase [Pseudomonadota bacterium]